MKSYALAHCEIVLTNVCSHLVAGSSQKDSRKGVMVKKGITHKTRKAFKNYGL